MGIEDHPGVLTEPPERVSCEIAVIGSGPGGAVTASVLANAGRDVLVVEEGPLVPASACRPFSREEMERKYRNGGVTVALGSPKVTYAEGCCVGGGSEVNAGLFYRAPGDVLERWGREYRIDGIAFDDLAPHFERIEKDLQVGVAKGHTSLQAAKLHEGAIRLGLSSRDSPTSFRAGAAFVPSDTPEQQGPQRASMSRTYLRSALDAGARLVPDTRVGRLVRSGGRWSLRCRRARATRELEVLAEHVFVAGGAVQTPALLRRSGIRRNVGNSLGLHATLKITARFPDEINEGNGLVPTWAIDEFAPRSYFTCAISTREYLALELLQYPDYFREIDRNWRRMGIYSARVSGGRGIVRNVPGFRDPLVYFRFSEHDLAELSQAAQQLGSCLFAAGADALFPSVLLGAPIERPGALYDRLSRLPRHATNLMTIHLFSSCPMGGDESRCPTDSFGGVRGAPGLHVADASLLCSAPTVNPQATIMAIARRNALHFLGAL
jgi:choline dehydrogenase-like flavoprotein